MKIASFALAAVAAATMSVKAEDLRITEIMYTGLYGEFVEITNINAGDADLGNVQYSDNHNFSANKYILQLPDIDLAEGDSIIVTEAAEEIFDLAWYALPNNTTTVTRPATLAAVVGDVTVNLGRADSVILRDHVNSNLELDRLDFDDEADVLVHPNQIGPRTEDVSAVPNVAPNVAIPDNDFSTWVTSEGENADGDDVGLPEDSATPWKSGRPSSVGTMGSPGVYNLTVAP